MIHVDEQPEPPDFRTKVRDKGATFLAQTSHPTNWRKKEFWKLALPDLWNAYSGICAYTCHWIPRDTGVASVEHFIPKSHAPHLAYDWQNYRLVSLKMNGRKGDYQDVLDPFTLQTGWFIMGFPDMLVRPAPNLTVTDTQAVITTIKRLKLNDDDTCVQSRFEWLLAYCKKDISFKHLQNRAPFIAIELQRQNLVDTVHTMISAALFMTTPICRGSPAGRPCISQYCAD